MAQGLLLLVVGAGRSGTSSFAGVLNHLGFHVPPPVVGADDSNPRGHFEPRWAVEFHKRILEESGYRLVDGDPQAGRRNLEIARNGAYYDELREWLASVSGSEQRIVVKDPRTVWVAPLWAEAAKGLGLRVVFVTMLRHAAGVMGSHTHHYSNPQTALQRMRAETALVAGWINVNLLAEEVTRGAERWSIVYEDFLADWRQALKPLTPYLGISLDRSVDSEAARAADGFIDPSLHRVRRTWQEGQIPAMLRSLADALWTDLVSRAREEIDESTYLKRVEQHRLAFRQLYRESDMIARDRTRRSVQAARRSGYRNAIDDATKALDTLT